MKLRMVDRIIDWQSRRSIVGVKTVSFEEYGLKSAWGDAHMPESLLMESLFQLGNWLIMLSSDFTRMGLLVRIGEVQFHEQLGPGGSLRMELEVASYRDDGIVFSGSGVANGREVISGRGCLARPVGLADFCSADDLRVLFSEIYRPLEKGPA